MGKGKQKNRPTKWYELDAVVKESDVFIKIGEREFYASEPVEDILVFTVPEKLGAELVQQFLASIKATIEAAGITRPVLVLPAEVKFARLREVSPETENVLNKVHGKHKPLAPNTPTMGEA